MRSSIFALVVATTLAATASAQQPPAPPPPPPGDPFGGAAISRADAQDRAGKMFDRFDANHDGKLDQADRTARMTAKFDQVDTNHDGAIGRDEFAAAHERMGKQMRDRMGGRGRGPGGDHRRGGDHADKGPRGMDHGAMGPGAMGPGAMPPPPPGGDARAPLSRAAFVAEALKRFDAADSNHDGKVTAQERRTAMRAQRGHRGPGPAMPPPPPAMGS